MYLSMYGSYLSTITLASCSGNFAFFLAIPEAVRVERIRAREKERDVSLLRQVSVGRVVGKCVTGVGGEKKYHGIGQR